MAMAVLTRHLVLRPVTRQALSVLKVSLFNGSFLVVRKGEFGLVFAGVARFGEESD